MARVAERPGVEICSNEPVEEVLFTERRAIGVSTTTSTRCADAVVVNGDFARAIQK
jgi:phytoene desaturase